MLDRELLRRQLPQPLEVVAWWVRLPIEQRRELHRLMPRMYAKGHELGVFLDWIEEHGGKRNFVRGFGAPLLTYGAGLVTNREGLDPLWVEAAPEEAANELRYWPLRDNNRFVVLVDGDKAPSTLQVCSGPRALRATWNEAALSFQAHISTQSSVPFTGTEDWVVAVIPSDRLVETRIRRESGYRAPAWREPDGSWYSLAPRNTPLGGDITIGPAWDWYVLARKIGNPVPDADRPGCEMLFNVPSPLDVMFGDAYTPDEINTGLNEILRLGYFNEDYLQEWNLV